jgi:hypothetical protein
MKKNTILLSLIVVPFLIGCGGSSSTPTTSTNKVAKISGTVPGTLIEAFCDDGSYVQVTSTQNGTNEHPFDLTIPQNTKCTLVMTTNENDPATRVITPIGYVQGNTTGNALTLTGDVDLGNIPLATSPADINDTNGDQVSDESLEVNLGTSTGVSVSNDTVQDNDNDGMVDAYNDDDNDGTVNAYEDDDGDNVENIHDDKDGDKKPDYLEDDDNDGKINHRDDDDQNNQPDYAEDDDNDGKANHIDDDDNNGNPDYTEDNDNDGKANHIDDDNNNGTPDYLDDDDNDGKSNHIDTDDDGNGIDDDNEQNEGTDLN